MLTEQSQSERSHHVRASARGNVVLRASGSEVHARGICVRENELEVRCQRGLALLSAGASVEVEMQLDDVEGSAFIVHGYVARIRSDTQTLVVALEEMPWRLATLLAEVPLTVIEVMIVDRDHVRRSFVASAFRAEGCHVVEAGDSAKAIAELEDAPFATDVIAVGDSWPEEASSDLACLETSYEGAVVIAIGDLEWTPFRTRLDPTEPEHLFRASVHSLVLGVAK